MAPPVPPVDPKRKFCGTVDPRSMLSDETSCHCCREQPRKCADPSSMPMASYSRVVRRAKPSCSSAVMGHVFSLACLLFFANLVVGFNLEPRIPVVKRGVPGSYFGYSVAMHQSVDPITNADRESWLLVGAPVDKNLQPETNRSGALYKCPITTWTSDCEQVFTDGARDPATGEIELPSFNRFDIFPPNFKEEIKENQWLGVTVRSAGKGKKVMVCAHRYVRKQAENRWGQGLCYTLTQLLDWDQDWQPCSGEPVRHEHEQYGFCQAGTNGFLTPDDDVALIGAPGPYTWRGTVYAYNISEDFLNRDKTKYYVPVQERESPVDKYSYLGFSTTAGHFFPDEKTSYVSGAPRSNGTGQVFFFKRIPRQSLMKVQLSLSGDVFASSYGYEMASADINGDGMTDLVVGAPFHYAKNSGGAVYIYINTASGFKEDHPYTKITGEWESRFGFAIANIGDVNLDGYEDIAVGAPYDGNGVVFIYLGSKNGIIEKVSQVIRSEDLNMIQPPRTFGYSLSGGLDLDRNGYPDLLVGCYSDDKVIMIRARPIVDIETRVEAIDSFTNIDPASPGCKNDSRSSEVCFSFSACFRMRESKSIRTGTNLELSYRIEAETFTGRKFSRVYFANGLAEQPNVVKKDTALSSSSFFDFHCFTETVYVREGTSDIQSPIPFRMTYSLVQPNPRQPSPGASLPDMADYPILNQQEAVKEFEATFLKDCGSDDVCQCELYLNVTTNMPAKYKDGNPLFILGELKEILVNVLITNLGEPAYLASLYISHSNTVSFIQSISRTSAYTCRPVNETYIKCNLGNPLKRGTGELKLRFSPTNLTDLERTVEFNIAMNTTSEDLGAQSDVNILVRVVMQAELSITGVAHPELPTYGGEVRGESSIKSLEEIGTRVDHVYQVANDGPSTANRMTIVIDWPYQVENGREQGKWLLYLIEKPIVEGDGECVIADGAINPLRLQNVDKSNDQPLLYGYGSTLSYLSSSDDEYSSSATEESALASVSRDVMFEAGETDGFTVSGTHFGPAGSVEAPLSSNDINDVEDKYYGSTAGAGSSKTSYSREEKTYNSKETRFQSSSKSSMSSSRAEISGSKSASSSSHSSKTSGSLGGYLDDYYDDDEDSTAQGGGFKRRRKRDLERRVEPRTITDKHGNSELVAVFDCQEGTAKCVQFRCDIRNLMVKQTATVHIMARLWNATLVEDYPEVNRALIRSRARIALDPNIPLVQYIIRDDVAFAETSALPDSLTAPGRGGVPWWAILLGVMGGLLLLGLIGVCLWWCGFFKRKKPDFTLSGNLERQRMNGNDY